MHLIVQGHPAPHSLSDDLSNAYARGLAEAGQSFEFLPLRSLEFDPHLRAGFTGEQALEPDLARARSAFERSYHVAWFFPTWWAGPPALVKGFVDRTFLPGWSFAYRKKNPLPEGLLRGRSARVVTTMDSPGYWYRFWHGRSVHTSFVNATLRFVGFGPVRETTFFNQKSRTPAERSAWIAQMERIGFADGKKARNASRASALPTGRPRPE